LCQYHAKRAFSPTDSYYTNGILASRRWDGKDLQGRKYKLKACGSLCSGSVLTRLGKVRSGSTSQGYAEPFKNYIVPLIED
jgi:hypothetical protein